MLKVRAIDCELVIGVELALQGVVAGPRVAAAALKDVHPVVNSWAVERAKRVDFRRWSVFDEVNTLDP